MDINEYAINNVKVKIILENSKVITGTVNIVGYNRFSDFIEQEKVQYLKLKDVTFAGNPYKFIMINRNKIIGYCPEE